MLFEFLKYTNPTWYFNLRPSDLSIPYFVDYRKLDIEVQKLINIDKGYITKSGRLADSAYQTWQKGIIKKDSDFSLFKTHSYTSEARKKTIELFKHSNVSVNQDIFVKNIPDNYRFIRRFFNPTFSFYILFLRLFSLYNPFQEIIGFFRSLKVKRIDPYTNNTSSLYNQDYETFSSSLITRNPSVSVIIPTLNRYTYLKDVLSDLEKQDYKNFEIIICDQSENFDEAFYQGWELDLKLIRQEEKALWLARNRCIKKAKGEYILLFDDDSRIEHDWIFQHLKCLDFFKCDISSGVSLSTVGDKVPANYAYFRWSDQVDTGNVMFRKDLMKITGMFDRQFEKQRQGDGEFGLRCYLLGFTNVSNPLSKRIHLKAEGGGLRQMGSWDGLRPKKLFAPRPIPSIIYLTRKYFGNHITKLMLLSTIPGSIIPYKYKWNKTLKKIAYLALVISWPFILCQVLISWWQANEKLNQGPDIDILN